MQFVLQLFGHGAILVTVQVLNSSSRHWNAEVLKYVDGKRRWSLLLERHVTRSHPCDALSRYQADGLHQRGVASGPLLGGH
eukprot:symbB.v1.2.021290.t1/scaffold1833.1/size99481/8